MSETNDQAEESAKLRSESIALAAALHTIISESTDPEVMRIALAALQSTDTGQRYLNANPLRY